MFWHHLGKFSKYLLIMLLVIKTLFAAKVDHFKSFFQNIREAASRVSVLVNIHQFSNFDLHEKIVSRKYELCQNQV